MGFNVIMTGLIPFTLNASLMKPRRGVALLARNEKLGVARTRETHALRQVFVFADDLSGIPSLATEPVSR